jgi:hypothetical protein
VNSNKEVESYIEELLKEESAEEKNSDYTAEDWDRWEKETVKEAQALIDECKD